MLLICWKLLFKIGKKLLEISWVLCRFWNWIYESLYVSGFIKKLIGEEVEKKELLSDGCMEWILGYNNILEIGI